MKNYLYYFANGGKYTIKQGDTLTKIAKANGVTIQDLVALNNITDPNKIYAGQSLFLQRDTPAAINPSNQDTPSAFGAGVPVERVFKVINGDSPAEEKRTELKKIFKGKWTNNPEVLAALQGAGVMNILTDEDLVELSASLAQQPEPIKNIPFKKAFRQARIDGKQIFEWNGKKYNTKLK